MVAVAATATASGSAENGDAAAAEWWLRRRHRPPHWRRERGQGTPRRAAPSRRHGLERRRRRSHHSPLIRGVCQQAQAVPPAFCVLGRCRRGHGLLDTGEACCLNSQRPPTGALTGGLRAHIAAAIPPCVIINSLLTVLRCNRWTEISSSSSSCSDNGTRYPIPCCIRVFSGRAS